ncbi:DNA methyltransferase [uncultured Bacteroides sp.]|uniref:DNA methyltransferase n=1 Tax=uncultured Bacteroides sp. TaxID=162156 RepID=UPI0027D9969E|nr:DNA methyltransferase [uncultured Bacteroides sp.]
MSSKDISPRLFLDDEFEETKIVPDKVVCLGIEFPSEDARREYFRAELRKKLPELKQIEGFPIGEDDDIINLSDPPYYTACPNPWLNDFIEEWEKEKVELEKEGKRKANFEVKTPYAADVSEGKNNPIYMAHAYHTKVPHPAIMRYILHYTQPGDIVFDGFCGTGMTGVAAQLCGSENDVKALKEENAQIGVRHGICSDLSPIASLIAATYNLKFDPKTFERKASRILEQVEKELGWMYETEVDGKKAKINYTIWSDVFVCPSCGNEIVLWDEAVDLDKEIMKDSFPCPHCGNTCSKKNMEKAWETSFDSLLNKTVTLNKKVPVRVNYTLSGKRGEKDVDSYDIDLIRKIENINLSEISTYKLQEGYNTAQPIRSNGITHTHQFYTKRNFIYLNKIYELTKCNPIITIWFTSIIQNSSKMYKFRLDRKGGIVNGTLFIPSLNIEQNIVKLLHSKIQDIKNTFYNNRDNSVISILSATQLSTIRNSSIDYIFTDPPFGGNIMYSELSSIWESWIKVVTNNKEEAIINNVQHKTLFEYQTLMNQSFKEYYRVLKAGKWLTIEFSNTSASVWNSIQNALQGVGFVVVNVAALDKKQGSFKAVTTTTAVKQDLVITCYKPSDAIIEKFEKSEDKAKTAMDFIEELLVHLPVHLSKGESTTAVIERSPKILFDRLISYYVQKGYAIPMDAQEFQKQLRERFIERDGMFFTASQAIEYEQKKEKCSGFVPMALFISSEAEGIEWLKRELQNPQTYSDLQPEWMKNMLPPKKGDVLPELMSILEENFIKDEEGNWRNPDPEKAADLEIIRNRRMMKEFNMYLEQAQKPKAKRMKDTRLEVLRYGFKECYKQKNYQAIVTVGDHILESLLQEDEVLLQYYDIASSRV